jgi:hypothetical protein
MNESTMTDLSTENVMGRKKIQTEFWCGNMGEGIHLEEQLLDWKNILKWT